MLAFAAAGANIVVNDVTPGSPPSPWSPRSKRSIVSDAGRTGDAHLAVYSAAKAGAAGLTPGTRGSRTPWGHGQQHRARHDENTQTEPLWADPDSSQAKAILRNYILRRPGLPDEVAPLAVFLASPYGAWITGQTYPVNGGFSLAL